MAGSLLLGSPADASRADAHYPHHGPPADADHPAALHPEQPRVDHRALRLHHDYHHPVATAQLPAGAGGGSGNLGPWP